MIQPRLTQTTTRFRSVAAFAFLATICCVAAESKADTLINVTSVNNQVQITDDLVPFDHQSTNGAVAGSDLIVSQGTGDFNTGGYLTRLLTSNSTSAINVNWQVDIPTAGAVDPDAGGEGVAEVFFTAFDDADYTAFGDSQFGDGRANHGMAFELENLTTGQILAQGSDGSFEGSPFNSFTGLTGSIVAGNDYKWTYEFATSKRDDFSTLGIRSTGIGGLNFTASAVPEPTSAGILGCIGVLAFMRRRRK